MPAQKPVKLACDRPIGASNTVSIPLMWLQTRTRRWAPAILLYHQPNRSPSWTSVPAPARPEHPLALSGPRTPDPTAADDGGGHGPCGTDGSRSMSTRLKQRPLSDPEYPQYVDPEGHWPGLRYLPHITFRPIGGHWIPVQVRSGWGSGLRPEPPTCTTADTVLPVAGGSAVRSVFQRLDPIGSMSALGCGRTKRHTTTRLSIKDHKLPTTGPGHHRRPTGSTADEAGLGPTSTKPKQYPSNPRP